MKNGCKATKSLFLLAEQFGMTAEPDQLHDFIINPNQKKIILHMVRNAQGGGGYAGGCVAVKRNSSDCEQFNSTNS